MSALVLPALARIRKLFAAAKNWTCDLCGTVNSDSVTTCYRCGS